MADNPLSEYVAKLRELDEATAAVQRTVDLIHATSQDLQQDWRQVSVSNVTGGFFDHVMASGRRINASQWPTGQQIADLLIRWHTLHFAAERAYSEFPEDQRAEIHPPPY